MDTTVRARVPAADEEATSDRLQLIVHADEEFFSFQLPACGEVTIGRSDTSSVRIPHSSVSRDHAVLVVGETLRIRDVGSANGTWVAKRRLAPLDEFELAIGDAFVVGTAMVIVQRIHARPRPRRPRTHEYFEARVEEECVRRSEQSGGFAIARVLVRTEADDDDVTAALYRIVRPRDVVALYAPQQYELLLDGAETRAAADAIAAIRTTMATRGIGIQTAIALYPNDGVTADALFARLTSLLADPEADVPPSQGLRQIPLTSAMDGLRELVARVAASDISVLILGETGVGKEVLAETLHRQSRRVNAPFLRLHCAALPDTLLESELFGHERGAFTGATTTKRGLLETADGGTILLDEIGELPLGTQVKLLRVLEERTVTRIGALSSRVLDVRFIAATNRDLEAEVARGAFRQDLYFRLNGITIAVPPLRERLGELESLAKAFIAAAARNGARPQELSEEVLRHLLAYSWPGNIRELRNVIDRAIVIAGDEELSPKHLPLAKMTAASPRGASLPNMPPQSAPERASVGADTRLPAPPKAALKDELEALERARILEAMDQCAWNQTKAAELLGLSRGILMARLDQYGIGRPRKRSSV